MDRIIEKKKWTLKKIATIAAASLFGLFIIYLLFFRDKSSRLNVEKSKLTIATVKEDKFQEFIPIDGVVHPKRTVYLDAAQGGRVEKIFVEDGAILDEGDLIMKLSNSDIELNFMQQQTQMYEVIDRLQNTKLNIEQTRFTRENEMAQLSHEVLMAKDEFKRQKKFYEENVISKKEYLDAKRDYELKLKKLDITRRSVRYDSLSSVKQIARIDDNIDRMYTNLQLLKKNLELLFIKAPISGKLSNFSAEIGETKNRGENLGQIDILDGFKLRASIDERYINRVYKGQGAEFDFEGQAYQLEVDKIYTQVSQGSFEVDMIFKNETPEDIKRGQTLQLRLKFSGVSDAVIVRRGGFYQETGGNWIYVVDETGNFAYKRDIRIGRQNTRYYEVLEGLKPGEKVVISSYDNFGDKDKLIFK